MEKSDNSRKNSCGQVQPEDAAHKHGTGQDSLAEGAQEHQRTPSRVQHSLRRALLDSKAENKLLVSVNIALRQQIADMEFRWRKEKKMLQDKTDSLVSTLFMARIDMDNLVKMVESTRASQKKAETERRQMARNMKDKEKEMERRVTKISLEKDDLVTAVREKQMALVESMAKISQQETEICQKEMVWHTKYTALEGRLALEQAEKKASCERMQELQDERTKLEEQWQQIADMEFRWRKEKKMLQDKTDSLVSTLFMARNDMDNLVKMVESTRASQKKAETERRQMARNMKDKEKEMERRVTKISLEKDDLVTAVREKQMALVESMAKISQQETEIYQKEMVWHTKYTALEGRLALEQAEKKASCERMQELQDERTKLEEQWRHKESQMEEEMRLLILRNAELQELSLKTDREKAQIKKQEKKAKKEKEKRLKKERKENEKREKEEKEENDRKERENLKQEKKEKEKKEKEMKEKAKREKKEREENDKKEREDLKREKKEKEKKEKEMKEKAKREKKEKRREE